MGHHLLDQLKISDCRLWIAQGFSIRNPSSAIRDSSSPCRKSRFVRPKPNLLLQPRHEGVERHRPPRSTPPRAHGDGAVPGLALSDDEEVRNLLHGPVPDLRPYLLGAEIRFHAEFPLVKRLLDGLGVRSLRIRHREDPDLYRGKPGGERPSVMPDEDAEEPFQRPQEGPVNHVRVLRPRGRS